MNEKISRGILGDTIFFGIIVTCVASVVSFWLINMEESNRYHKYVEHTTTSTLEMWEYAIFRDALYLAASGRVDDVKDSSEYMPGKIVGQYLFEEHAKGLPLSAIISGAQKRIQESNVHPAMKIPDAAVIMDENDYWKRFIGSDIASNSLIGVMKGEIKPPQFEIEKPHEKKEQEKWLHPYSFYVSIMVLFFQICSPIMYFILLSDKIDPPRWYEFAWNDYATYLFLLLLLPCGLAILGIACMFSSSRIITDIRTWRAEKKESQRLITHNNEPSTTIDSQVVLEKLRNRRGE